MSYFEKENEARKAPTFAEEHVPQGAMYTCKFIEAGAVGYRDGVYLLEQEALDRFAYTLKLKPVIIGHQDIIDEKDMKEKAVGMVTDVWRNDSNGKWYCNFCIWDPKAMKKIDEGTVPYVSCGYRADLTTEDTDVNNVKYKKRIVGGEMKHLALVKNPRYNGTEIWKNSDDDYFVSEGELYNQKEGTMFCFKKEKVSLDEDILINTKDGDKTIKELINELEAAKETIAEQEGKIKDLETANEELKAAAADKDVQPEVEPKEPEAPEATDASLKKDLNNALAEEIEPKVMVVEIPKIKM